MRAEHRHRHGKRVEELLEEIWTLKEEGKSSLSDLLEFTKEDDARQVVDYMVKHGLITLRGEEIELTGEGEAIAREIVRRHRWRSASSAMCWRLARAWQKAMRASLSTYLAQRLQTACAHFWGILLLAPTASLSHEESAAQSSEGSFRPWCFP